jgi:flagellar assembly factor FliW
MTRAGSYSGAQTARFGRIHVRPDEVIVFPNGIPPFGAYSRYCLIELRAEAPVQWIQCLDEPALVFAAINPVLVVPEYAIEITEADARDLELRASDDASLLALLAAHEHPRRVTANLRAPIVINHVRRLGKQVILPAADYAVQHVVCAVRDEPSGCCDAVLPPVTSTDAQEEHAADRAVPGRRNPGCLSSPARSPRAS